MDDATSALARQWLEVRRIRVDVLPAFLFDEFAWDMLLILYVAAHDGEAVDEAMLIERCMADRDTGVRWLKALEQHDMIEVADAVALTGSAMRLMRDYLMQCLTVMERQ